ncbi:hypothetical protein [Proteiniclasticum sp.]|uniref:hypothetical protein n=1 Tax=Proteiniclasticum sp. TaxID=2053595 RepID=UPI0028991767|nr:hypothetical protein [Proteiniclasticum sp.]
MTTYISLLEKKKNILQEAYQETEISGDDIEEYINVLAVNNRRFDELKAIQVKLSLHKDEGSKEEEIIKRENLDLLVKIKANTFKIQRRIEEEKKITANALNDFSSVKQVASNYVKKEQGPVFVDKDF